MAALDSSSSGECQGEGDKRDGADDQLLELELPPPVPCQSEGDGASTGDKNAEATGVSSDLSDNRGDQACIKCRLGVQKGRSKFWGN